MGNINCCATRSGKGGGEMDKDSAEALIRDNFSRFSLPRAKGSKGPRKIAVGDVPKLMMTAWNPYVMSSEEKDAVTKKTFEAGVTEVTCNELVVAIRPFIIKADEEIEKRKGAEEEATGDL